MKTDLTDAQGFESFDKSEFLPPAAPAGGFWNLERGIALYKISTLRNPKMKNGKKF